MEENYELKALEAEIAKLKKQKEELEKIRQLKMEKFRLKYNNIPEKFAASHPVLASVGKRIINNYKQGYYEREKERENRMKKLKT